MTKVQQLKLILGYANAGIAASKPYMSKEEQQNAYKAFAAITQWAKELDAPIHKAAPNTNAHVNPAII